MAKYKSEKKLHDKLLNLLKEHFIDDETEIKDEEMEPVNNMTGRKKEKSYEEDDDMDLGKESYDFGDENRDESAEYCDELMEEKSEDEDEERKLPKNKRKAMAIIIATKKAGRAKSKKM